MLKLLLPLCLLSSFHPVAAQENFQVDSRPRAGLPPSQGAGPSSEMTPAVSRKEMPLTGLVTIESDLQKADNSTGVVTASGNVRILYADRGVVATAKQAQYFSKEGRVVLSGEVDVKQDNGNSIRAEKIIYLVDRERIIAEPAAGEQVIIHYFLNTPIGPGIGNSKVQKPQSP